VLVAARKCGLSTVFPLGGAQAIAAMAYGTETVGKSDKIFGPGNRYVDAAKRFVSIDPDGAAIDLPAGPSELMIIADETANASFVAADLLAQAEHDVVAHVLLVTTSATFADQVDAELRQLLDALPQPQTAATALASGCSIIVAGIDEAIAVANQYAPEHLIVVTRDDESTIDHIETAGSVFAGMWTPAALGDYCSGTNHVLPTGGFARAYSGLSVESFLRFMTVQTATQPGFEHIGPIAATLARAEGLTAHKRSVEIRLANAGGSTVEDGSSNGRENAMASLRRALPTTIVPTAVDDLAPGRDQ
jgi:histidinol dehydrogenase